MNKINNKITKRFWIASAFRLAMTDKGRRPSLPAGAKHFLPEQQRSNPEHTVIANCERSEAGSNPENNRE